jgi:hypothetical protein
MILFLNFDHPILILISFLHDDLLKMNKEIKIPKFHIVSTNPDRENTEDYLRKHLDIESFYKSR